MGHDHHFLSRLDRITREQVDLALTLYRDEELVKYILLVAKAQEGTRVAISLGRDEGPFLVLAHDGHFVTCLGRGMSPSGLPRFSRRWLDATISAYGKYRDGVARARRRTADQDATGGLLRAIGARAHGFSREDFSAIRPITGVLGTLWLDSFRVSFRAIRDVLEGALKCHSNGSELTDSALELYWKSIWGSSHAIVMAGCADEDVARWLAGSWKVVHSPTVGLYLPDIQIFAVRAAWFAAQHGDAFLPLYDRALKGAAEEGDIYDACAALLAMAVKWPSLRRPIRRIFAETRVRAELEPLRLAYATLATTMLDKPALAEEVVLDYGRQCASALREPDAEPASLDLALSYGIVNPGDAFLPIAAGEIDHSFRGLLRLAAVCAAAGRDAEVLFLPEAENVRLTKELVTTLARSNIDRLMKSRLGDRPVVRPVTRARVGRNDPCPCGSGKKMKKCCPDASARSCE